MNLLDILIATALCAAGLPLVFSLIAGNETASLNAAREIGLFAQTESKFITLEEAVIAGKPPALGAQESDGVRVSEQSEPIDAWTDLLTEESVLAPARPGAGLSLSLLDPHLAQAFGRVACGANAASSTFSVSASLALPSANGSVLTGLALNGRYAYAALDSSRAQDPDLVAIDIADPARPAVSAALDSGPGLAALFSRGTLLFAANTSINGQLEIFSLENPAVPSLIKAFKIPGAADAAGESVSVLGTEVMLGLMKSAVAEIQYINVSNPYAPQIQDAFETNGTANAVLLGADGNFAATPGTDLYSLSTSSPPLVIGTFSADGSAQFGGNSLAVFESYLVLGRTASPFTTTNELYLFSLAEPRIDRPISRLRIGASVNSIVSGDNGVFLATGAAGREFAAIDASDPANLRIAETLPLSGKAAVIACENKTLYVGVESPPELFVITAP